MTTATLPAARTLGARPAPAALIVASLTLIAAVGATSLALPSPQRLTWEAPLSPPTIALYGTSVCLLALSAVFLTLEPPPRARVDATTAVIALALAAEALAVLARTDIAPGLRVAATVVAAAGSAALLHLTLAVARSTSPWTARIVVMGYAACTIPAIGRAVVTEPFRDPYCLVGCDVPMTPLLPSPTLSQVFALAWLAVAALVSATAAAVGFTVLVRRTQIDRAVLAAVVLVALTEASIVLLPDTRPLLGPPPQHGDDTLMAVRAAAGIALALTLLFGAGRRRRRMRRFVSAMDALARDPRGGSLQSVLAHALHDDGISVAYWLPSLGKWMDPVGREASDEDPRAVTLSRSGAPVARIHLSRGDLTTSDLEPIIGPAARLVIDNERLRMELLVQADALQASRRRVVEESDAVRRRLERDLHDGAQQRLLAATFALRMAMSDPGDAAAEEAERRLTSLLAVLDALRETARGLYPPVLADAGLVPALESLARAGAPLSVDAEPAGFPRASQAVELTAYLTVKEAVAAEGHGPVAASVMRTDGVLRLELAGVSAFRPARVADRIAALGGTLMVGEGRVRMEVPCE